MKSLLKKAVFLLVVLAITATLIIWQLNKASGESVSFRTAKVMRGDLVSTINSTGTVEPEDLVDVGAQVIGRIISFGKDEDGNEVDFGSPVAEGTVLAKIDDSSYLSDVALASAQLEQAKAGLENAQANLLQMNAKLHQAQLDWERAQKLGPSEALSKSSYDSYKAAFEVAQADVNAGEAAVSQAKANINQSDAMLQKANLNYGYCTIKSPVEGVIIDRRVNIGQTVVSSLNAPSLFLIAKDLKKMQVWVSVNEADIGKIYTGQPVTFTVSTYEDQIFKGVVGQVRLNATLTQNVVTYTVEVGTDNSNGKLLPYLTANIYFETAHKENVLMVANSALRWQPATNQVVPEFRSALNEYAGENENAPTANPDTGEKTKTQNYKQGILWIEQSGLARPVKVYVGISNDNMTEIQSDELKEGSEVIIGERQSAGSSGTVNPFTPQFRRGGQQNRGQR